MIGIEECFMQVASCKKLASCTTKPNLLGKEKQQT